MYLQTNDRAAERKKNLLLEHGAWDTYAKFKGIKLF